MEQYTFPPQKTIKQNYSARQYLTPASQARTLHGKSHLRKGWVLQSCQAAGNHGDKGNETPAGAQHIGGVWQHAWQHKDARTALTLRGTFKFSCDVRTSNAKPSLGVQVWNYLPAWLGHPWLEVVAVLMAMEFGRRLEGTGQMREGTWLNWARDVRSSHKLTSKVAPMAVATCPPSDVVKGAGSLVLPFM